MFPIADEVKEIQAKLEALVESGKNNEAAKVLENMDICVNAVKNGSRRHFEVLLPKIMGEAKKLLES